MFTRRPGRRRRLRYPYSFARGGVLGVRRIAARQGTAVAYAALFVALGGTGYAAVNLSRNSVRSTHIQNGQVKAVDVAKNAVDSRHVEDRSLLAEDFKAGELVAGASGPRGPKGDSGAQGAVGATGATGATGSAGIAGAAGPAGLSGLENVFAIGPFNSDSPKVFSVSCPPGKKVVGMGGNLNAQDEVVQASIHQNYLLASNDLATVTLRGSEVAGGTGGNWNLVPQAICATVAP